MTPDAPQIVTIDLNQPIIWGLKFDQLTDLTTGLAVTVVLCLIGLAILAYLLRKAVAEIYELEDEYDEMYIRFCNESAKVAAFTRGVKR